MQQSNAMNSWLDPLRVALGKAPAPVTFFFRDDDAGWDDARLHPLLDLFERHATPLDLAVIPEALSPTLARSLLKRRETNADLLGLHQHGFRHLNHEVSGRKCEFGPSRNEAEQLNDIALGQRRLELLIGSALDSIFTPPWNRCTQFTVDALVTLGIRVLSREARATPLDLKDVEALPVCVDWCKRRDSAPRPVLELGEDIAHWAAMGRPVGIMLHHAIMQQQELDTPMNELLNMLSQHPRARCRLMREVAGLTVLEDALLVQP